MIATSGDLVNADATQPVPASDVCNMSAARITPLDFTSFPIVNFPRMSMATTRDALADVLTLRPRR